MQLEVRLVNGGTYLPERANPTDAGLDLFARERVVMQVGCRTLVPLGVATRIPPGYVGLLVPRSSLSKRHIIMTNSVGVIDADYRGEIMASLMYHGDDEVHTIAAGEKIVQLLVMPIALPEVEEVVTTDEMWNDTQRGLGGFGSTGK